MSMFTSLNKFKNGIFESTRECCGNCVVLALYCEYALNQIFPLNVFNLVSVLKEGSTLVIAASLNNWKYMLQSYVPIDLMPSVSITNAFLKDIVLFYCRQ